MIRTCKPLLLFPLKIYSGLLPSLSYRNLKIFAMMLIEDVQVAPAVEAPFRKALELFQTSLFISVHPFAK